MSDLKSKFKVDDWVIVREGLEPWDVSSDGITFVDGMSEHLGKSYQVRTVVRKGYELVGTAGWVFAEEWLLPAPATIKIVELPLTTVATEDYTPKAVLLDLDQELNQGLHSHYYKNVSHLNTIDVYRILELFNVTDPCLQHMVKKCLVAGGRGGGKDISKDIQEVIDTAERWKQMQQENALLV